MNNPQKCILIIDDDTFNHILLMSNLEDSGYRVEVAVNGLEGLSILREKEIDLVLLDLLMPEMDGFEVLKQMMLLDTWRLIPVIITSAEIDIETILRCIDMGAIDYLTKPFDPVLLQARIKNVLLASSYLKTLPKDSPGRMLVIDDDPSYRMLLTCNLEDNGHTVWQAENGKIALELMDTQVFDLIFLDLLMPEMDGFTFLEKIKTDPVLVNLPVIVISAEEDMDGIVRCLEMGATDYLNKPYEPAILKARLNASLSTKRFHDKEKAYIRTIQSSQMAVSLENVKLHESVHSQREQYEALIDNIPVGICRIKVSIKTGESQFIQVNPALGKMFGYDSIEELLDKNVSEMYASQKEKHLFIQILSEKGHCKNVELQFKRKDNSFVVVSCNAKAKFNRDKDVLMIDGVIEDVTEKKKAEADRANFVQELCTINEAYERFVPSEFLDLLQKGKITDVVLGDHIQQEMHIMFSDIRSFTTLSETMTPKENFQFINAYLNKISRKIRENKGFIDKFIGDGIMALFPENASDAIDAGIAMLGALRQYNEQRKTKNRTPIRIGIGIHTGSVILGTVGDRDRMEGTVISDSVNLASRIEGLTKKYSTSILVSEQTFMKVPDERKYAYRILGNTNVKGKVDPVVIIEILNGNSQEIIDLKLSTKMDFEFGIILYQSGDYKNAKEAFQKVLSKNPNDKTAEAYLNNSKYFEIHGAPSEWEKTDMMEKNI